MADEPEIYDEPSNIEAKDGVVSVDGPDGVDVSLTPDAALETSDRLLAGAATAQGQKRRGDDASSVERTPQTK
jgi:hypothetical protein